MPLSGKRVLVTGAERGIGRGVALAMARAGADVALHYYPANADLAVRVEAEITAMGRQSALFPLDLADCDAVPTLAHKVWADFGPVEVLVNNAAICEYVSFLETSAQTWQKHLAVNLTSPFLLSQVIAQKMVSAQIHGSIIHISSANAVIAAPGQTAYTTAKAGLSMLGKGMARELGVHGIRVNMIGPAAIGTELAAARWGTPEGMAQLPWYVPMQRLGTPDDVGGAAVFLAGPSAEFITGTTIFVDGGVLTSKR